MRIKGKKGVEKQRKRAENVGVEKVYTDKMSGKSKDRPELQKMMDFVREGDILVVESISRFARNVRNLLDLVATLNAKGTI